MAYETQGFVYFHAVLDTRIFFFSVKKFYFLLSFQTEMENPWQVNSIEAFAYLKCPECDFDSKAESSFKSHAVKTHPLSHVFFGNATVDNNTQVTILKYDPNDIDNYIQENYEELQLVTTNLLGKNIRQLSARNKLQEGRLFTTTFDIFCIG